MTEDKRWPTLGGDVNGPQIIIKLYKYSSHPRSDDDGGGSFVRSTSQKTRSLARKGGSVYIYSVPSILRSAQPPSLPQ